MNGKILYLSFAVFTFGLASPVAAAGMADYVGIWQCEQGTQSFNVNSKLPTVYAVFKMQLNADGSMYAEGNMNQNPFQAQARWEVTANGIFNSQGQMQDMLGMTPWIFSTKVTSTTMMNYQNIDQVNQSRTASACQKLQ